MNTKFRSFYIFPILILAFSCIFEDLSAQPGKSNSDNIEIDLQTCDSLLYAILAYDVLLQNYKKKDNIKTQFEPIDSIEDSLLKVWKEFSRTYKKKPQKHNNSIPKASWEYTLKAADSWQNAFEDEFSNASISEIIGLLPLVVNRIQKYQIPTNEFQACLKNRPIISKDVEAEEWISGLLSVYIYRDENEPTWLIDDRADLKHSEEILLRHFKNQIDTAYNINKIKQNWGAIVIIASMDSLEFDSVKGLVKLTGKPLCEKKLKDSHGNTMQYPICKSIRFSKSISANIQGTGFFIQPGTIATAYHLFEKKLGSPPYSSWRFILSYEAPINYEDGCVYFPKENVFMPIEDKLIDYGSGSEDWALVNVKSEYGRQKPLPFVSGCNTIEVVNNMQLYAMGHGQGLSKKYIFDGSIKGEDEDGFYLCNLDMFGGNSGSPIFDTDSHKVIGILSGGEWDYHLSDNEYCYEISTYNSGDGEKKEKVQSIAPIIQALNVEDVILSPKTKKEQTQTITTVNRSRNDNFTPSCDRTKKKIHAPYVYLSKNITGNDTIFTSFVVVPLYKKESLLFHGITNEGKGEVKIEYTIGKGGTLDYGRDSVLFMSKGTKDWDLTILVYDTIGIDTVFKTVLKKSNADTISYGFIESELAINCPYLYLTKPTGCDYHYPFVLIPINDFEIESEQLSLQDKSHLSIVKLHNPVGSNSNIFFPDVINEYRYIGFDGKQFAFEVDEPVQTSGLKKRKTIIRNQDADTKPINIDSK